MNLLVTGGLFLFAVVALVAVVFVIRSEPAAQESLGVPPPVPTELEKPAIQAIQEDLSSSGEAPALPDEEATLVAQNHAMNEWQSLAHGQLYELKNELRSLHEQAHGLAQHLQSLINMVERVEQAQDGRFPVEEQPSDVVNTPVAR